MAADPFEDPRPPRNVMPQDIPLVEERSSSEQVFSGKLLDVRRDTVRLPDGDTATREYVVHPGAVLIVPMQDDGRVIVVRQFRYPNNAVFIEFPAGKRDAGELPVETARRELREETGYEATSWTHLGRVHTVVSYSTETIELYLAQGLMEVGASPDHGEVIEIQTRDYDQIAAAVDRGEITDVKTIAALHFLERLRHPGAPITQGLVVRGRVQGVGYRDAMIDFARALSIAGWVRNRRDGSVEALVQGGSEEVAQVIRWARRGPPAAIVTDVEIKRAAHDPAMDDFQQRPSG